MSLLRRFIVAAAAMALATSVFAEDATTTTTTTTTTDNNATAPAVTTSADTTSATTTVQTTTAVSAEKVDLNKATAKELMKVKGLTASKAKALVSYRKKHGDFKSVEEIKEVKGFKKLNDEKLHKITEQLTVG